MFALRAMSCSISPSSRVRSFISRPVAAVAAASSTLNESRKVARATYLDSLSVDEAAATAATGRLLKERTRLEGEIEQLIARKASMQEAEYEATLERLFIELAKVNRSIKQAGT